MLNTSTTPTKPRLVLYGIGQYGGYIARFAIQKGWPIVAAFNRAGSKVGQDLGRVIGLERDIGVIVQDCESGDYESLRGKADIGVVAQTNLLRFNLPAYQRLMNVGLNIACHGSESYYPYTCNPELAQQIDDLARKNDVTFTGGGIWDMSRIWAGILVAGPCTALKALHHRSITDIVGQVVSKQQAQQVGAGFTVDQFYAAGLDKSPVANPYKSIPTHVLAALGYSVTACSVRIEPVVFEEAVHCDLMGGAVAAGDCVGTRILTDAETREGVTAKAEIELRLFRKGEVEYMQWDVVDGLPHSRVRVEREDSAHATAASLFNRIPQIIAAPAGIMPLSTFGPLRHTALI